MTTADLQERLRSGKGADRELDWEIHKLFWPGDRNSIPTEAPALTPAFTADLNAVFALVGRERPNAVVQISNLPQHFWGVTVESGGATHSDLTRAMLLALLAAKEQQP